MVRRIPIDLNGKITWIEDARGEPAGGYAPGMNPEPEFRTSSFCSGGNCVEVVIDADGVTCRDTTGGLAIYSHDEWRAFVAGVKAGEFDV